MAPSMNIALADEDTLEPLLAAVARGDQAAFAELYAQTSSRLFAILVRMLQRSDWAEEALQDVYLRIWRRSESYAPDRGAPLAWLSTIARYRALDLIRARGRAPADSAGDEDITELPLVDESARPEDHAAQQQGLDRLQQCLKGLSPEQRRSVLLSYYEGYTHSELAQRLEAPLGTVKSWVRRGLTQLRTCLEGA